MIRVLFVCMGNICRSPMAEAVFQHMVKAAGLENAIEADSAGTGDWHIGLPAHHGTLAILRDRNIPYDGRARHLQASDLEEFDYIATMDADNLRNVERLRSAASKAQIAPLLDYGVIAKSSGIFEVPDPYYDGGFENVYRLVQDGCAGLLEEIRSKHDL